MAVLVIMLAFTLAFTACSTDGDSGDTWTSITSANQNLLNGTWSGTQRGTESLKDFLGGEGEYDGSFGNIDGIQARSDFTLTLKIDASAGTVEVTQTQVATFFGGRINEVWASLKAHYEEIGITTNDSNHSVEGSGTFSFPLSVFVFNYGPEINQNGTRIKIFMDGDIDNIVLNKQ